MHIWSGGADGRVGQGMDRANTVPQCCKSSPICSHFNICECFSPIGAGVANKVRLKASVQSLLHGTAHMYCRQCVLLRLAGRRESAHLQWRRPSVASSCRLSCLLRLITANIIHVSRLRCRRCLIDDFLILDCLNKHTNGLRSSGGGCCDRCDSRV